MVSLHSCSQKTMRFFHESYCFHSAYYALTSPIRYFNTVPCYDLCDLLLTSIQVHKSNVNHIIVFTFTGQVCKQSHMSEGFSCELQLYQMIQYFINKLSLIQHLYLEVLNKRLFPVWWNTHGKKMLLVYSLESFHLWILATNKDLGPNSTLTPNDCRRSSVCLTEDRILPLLRLIIIS